MLLRVTFSIFLILLGAAPAAAQKVTLVRDSQLYSEPRLDAAPTAQLELGVTGEVIGKQGAWLNLKTPAGSGWVLTFNVRFHSEGSQRSSDTGLDRAWQCKPFLSTLWPPVLGFRNKACAVEEQDRLRSLLISHYGLDSSDPNSRTQGGQAFERDRHQRNEQERRAIDEPKWKRDLEIERTRREEEHAEERRQQAMIDERAKRRELQEAAVRERERQLKAGSIKIQNFVDAWLYYSPVEEIGSIMLSPLLSPDSGIYGGTVVLDAQQEKNLLRVTPGSLIASLVDYQRQIGVAYAFIRTTNKTLNYAPKAMRVNNEICIIGKYVGNLPYRTVLGTDKTAPLIEASHLGASVGAQCYYQPQTVTEFGLR